MPEQPEKRYGISARYDRFHWYELVQELAPPPMHHPHLWEFFAIINNT